MPTLKPEVYDILSAVIGKGYPVRAAKFIAAQAMLESANFESNVFKTNKNAFGMKMPSKRNSGFIMGMGSAAPSNEGPTPYAKFRSVSDSTKDLIHWLEVNGVKRLPGVWNTILDYAKFLKSKGYYGPSAETYAAGMGVHYNKMTDIIETEVPTVVNIPAWLKFIKRKWKILAGALALVLYFTFKKKGGKY